MALESIQFKLGITKDEEILKAIRHRKLWRKDKDGDYLSLMFDAREFKFRPGRTQTVGKTVGNGLIRQSAILVGNDGLSDEILPFIVKIKEWELGIDSDDPEEKSLSQFACPLCKLDMKTPPRLARHLMKVHKDDPRMQEVEGDEESESKSASPDASDLDHFDGADETESFEKESA